MAINRTQPLRQHQHQQQQQHRAIPIIQHPPAVPSQSLMLDPAPTPSSSLTQQELYTLPVYSDELGRLPLHGQVKFSAHAQTPSSSSGPIPSSSSSTHVLPSHLHQQHIPNPHPIDPGGLWYTFEQARLRGLQSRGMGLDGHGPSPSTLMNQGVGLPTGDGGLGVNESLGPDDGGGSQTDADYIFSQFALGYSTTTTTSYCVDSTSGDLTHMLNGVGMGMDMDMDGMGGQSASTRFGTGPGSTHTPPGMVDPTRLGDDAVNHHHHQHERHGFLDGDDMAMWSGAPTGFE
jgi:hypothetical protein